MCERMRMDDPHLDVAASRELLGPAGAGRRDPEHVDDRGAECRPCGGRTAGDRIRCGAAVPVREPGEGDEPRRTVDPVALLGDVADREDRRIARAVVLVDHDAAGGADLEARGASELGLRHDAHRGDDDGCGDLGAVVEDHPVGLDARDGVTEHELDAAAAHVLGQRSRHLGIQPVQESRRPLHDRRREPASQEVVRHLDADEPPADHDGRSVAGKAGERCHDPVEVVERAQHMQRGIGSDLVRPPRCRAGRQRQLVVGDHLAGAAAGRTRGHRPRRAIDRHHLAVHPRVDAESCREPLRGLELEGRSIGDLAGHVVREPAVREGDGAAALQHDDLALLVEPAQAGRGRHATGDAAHDHRGAGRRRGRRRLRFVGSGTSVTDGSHTPRVSDTPGYPNRAGTRRCSRDSARRHVWCPCVAARSEP